MSPPGIVLLDTCSDADVRRLSERIAAGAVTVFPTDTVYGIGCNALCASSVTRVFSAKHRDPHKALPVFVSDISRVLPWVEPAVRGMVRCLATAFWPGALTIVVNIAGSGIHTQPTPYPEASSIGFRVPRHMGLLRLLSTGLVLAQTSLNETGQTVLERLDAPEARSLLERADLVLDSRQRPEGRPSTVVELQPESWTMLREGSISSADVTAALCGGSP